MPSTLSHKLRILSNNDFSKGGSAELFELAGVFSSSALMSLFGCGHVFFLHPVFLAVVPPM